MNILWNTFLIQQSVQREQDRTLSFMDPKSERQKLGYHTVLADLTHYSLVAVKGADAEKFLQNQLTNDMAKIQTEQSRISGYCTPKGRLLAIFRILKIDAEIHLLISKSLALSTIQRLQKYVMMSKVRFDIKDETWTFLGIAGPNADDDLAKAGQTCPQHVNEVKTKTGITVIKIGQNPSRYIVMGETSALIDIWQRLKSDGATPVGYDAWNWFEVSDAYPEIYPETVEEFVPQMLNFEALDGLSFTKGCYPGQEIVARMNYLGTLKRRMFLLHTDIEQLPPPGEPLYSEHARAEDIVGKVVNASFSPTGGIDLLAVIQIAQADQKAIHLSQFDGALLQFMPLPYLVINPEKK